MYRGNKTNIINNNNVIYVELGMISRGDRKGKFWVAKISDYDPNSKYKFQREFMNTKTGVVEIKQPGIYEVYKSTASSKEHYFIVVEDDMSFCKTFDRKKIIDMFTHTL